MRQREGWIKIHRKMVEWEWYTDTSVFLLFVHLLLEANHKPGKWRGNKIGRGQLITGLHSLSEDTGLSIQRIRTALAKLKSTGEITIKSTNKFSLITICNYDAYQDKYCEDNKQNNTQLSNEPPSTNKPSTTNKNVKNNKNEKKKERFLLGLDVGLREDAQVIDAVSSWIESREYKRNCEVDAQVKLVESWSRGKLIASINKSVAGGYRALYEPKAQDIPVVNDRRTIGKDEKIVED